MLKNNWKEKGGQKRLIEEKTNQEKYKEIKEDLENLKKLNVDVYSVTCEVVHIWCRDHSIISSINH